MRWGHSAKVLNCASWECLPVTYYLNCSLGWTKAKTNITSQFCSSIQKQAFAWDPGIAQLIPIAIWKVLIRRGQEQAALLRLAAYAALGEAIYSDNRVLGDMISWNHLFNSYSSYCHLVVKMFLSFILCNVSACGWHVQSWNHKFSLHKSF